MRRCRAVAPRSLAPAARGAAGTLALTGLGLGLGLGHGGSAAAAGQQVSCRTVSAIPVALTPGGPASYSVSGQLCATPAELAAGATVQLLIPGATYNHSYWNFGTTGGISYSYAQDAAAAEFPAFAIDEIGAGST